MPRNSWTWESWCVWHVCWDGAQAVLQHFVEQLAMCTADLENLQSRQGRKRTERNGEWGAGEDSFCANKRGPKQNIKKKHGKTTFSVVVSFFYLLENNITPKLMGRRSPNLFGCIFFKVETTARIVKGAWNMILAGSNKCFFSIDGSFK